MSANSIVWRLVRRPVVFLGALGLVVALGFLGLFLSWTLTQASHATFTVNSTGDAIDASVGDGTCETTTAGECTLRAAIEEANAHAGTDTIAFNIPGAGPHTISPGSALSSITDPVVIDGTSEPDFVSTPVVELDGSNAGAANGLSITAGSSTVKGLVINSFSGIGIGLSINGGNTIEGNYIGTDITGTVDDGNRTGVNIEGAGNNTIGGTAAGAGNVISGNGACVTDCSGTNQDGIRIGGSTGNKIQGNLIGTDATGTSALGNSDRGILIGGDSNTIGGTTAGARNVISGNEIGMFVPLGTTGIVVEGNYIGTDVTGAVDLGNRQAGVVLHSGGNTIGGTAVGAGNVISGNQTGIAIQVTGGNLIQGNFIGTDAGGTAALGNSLGGIATGGVANIIGGTTAAARNVISGNSGYGIQISGNSTSLQVVQGNYIGTDVNGTADLGNTGTGILIHSAVTNNTIGGTAAGAGNVISGNGSDGVSIGNSPTTGNKIQGNLIGTDASGTSALGNGGNGVRIYFDASDNTIGGPDSGAGNTIAHNGGDGVLVESGTGNLIDPNSIHSNTGLGIDLGGGGPTANDVDDPDTGANNLQNYPLLNTALYTAGNTAVVGSLNSLATTTFTIEFFTNSSCDGSGFGEGETFVGSTDVTTDGTGNVSFSVSLAATVAVGQFVTATATDPAGNTSEFSECVEVRAGNTQPGTDVSVPLEGGLGSPGGIELTFDDVTGGGTTTVTKSTGGPPPPTGLKIVGSGGQPVYYDINTTATFSGPVTVCIAYDDTGLSASQESNLTLRHFDGSGWTDITSSLDTINNIICGETLTLSPFAVLVPIPPVITGPAVGGIVELHVPPVDSPQRQTGSGSFGLPWIVLTAGVTALGLGAVARSWYARRRAR